MEIVVMNAPEEILHRNCILGTIIQATKKQATWENVNTKGALIAQIPNGTDEDVRRLEERGLEVARIPF